MKHASPASLVLSLLRTVAIAQPTATVRTTVNGGASATIAPGGTVRIAVSVSHNLAFVAGIQGGTIIPGNAGVPSNFSHTFPLTPLINLGAFDGGSRVGADLAHIPPGTLGEIHGPFRLNPMPVWSYDLSLEVPGVYDINWVCPPSAPNVRLYTGLLAFNYVEAQTTFVGATITVTPTPPTAALLAPLALAARRRSRRTQELRHA